MNKKFRIGSLLLCLMLAVSLAFAGMIIAAADEGDETPSAEPVIVTGEDMADNLNSCLADAGSATKATYDLSKGEFVAAKSIFCYDEEVDGVDIDIKFEEGSAANSLFVWLRNNGHSHPDEEGAKGYVVELTAKNSGTAFEPTIYVLTGDKKFSESKAVSSMSWGGVALWDGNSHNIKFNAIDGEDGNTTISMTVDAKPIYKVVDEKAVTSWEVATLPKTDTSFSVRTNKYDEAKTPSAFRLKGATPPVLITKEDLTENAEYCLAGYNSSAKAPFESGWFGSTGGYFAYNKEVDGVDINLKYLETGTAKALFFVLRADGSGSKAPYDSKFKGLVAYVTLNGSEKLNVAIHRMDGSTAFASAQIGSGVIDCNIFDGEVHNIRFSAKDNTKSKTQIVFNIGDESVSTEAESLPKTGTSFYMSHNGAGASYQIEGVVIPDPELPEDIKTYTSKSMLKSALGWEKNAGAVLSADKINGVLAENGVLKANAGAYFKYTSEQALYKFNFKFGATGSIFIGYNITKNDAWWNYGTASPVLGLMVSGNTMAIKSYMPDTSYATVDLTGVDMTQGVEITFGAYEKSGKTFVYLELDETVKVHQRIAYTLHEGSFGFYGQAGCADFEITPTDDEIDTFPEPEPEPVPELPAGVNIYTSKSMFESGHEWNASNMMVTATALKGTTSAGAVESIARFGYDIKNALYKFNLKVTAPAGTWFSINLNATESKALWKENELVALRISGTNIIAEVWSGASDTTNSSNSVLQTIPIGSDVDLATGAEIICGLFTVTENNAEQAYVLLWIDGEEYLRRKVDAVCVKEGASLGFMASGTKDAFVDFEISATADDGASIPPAGGVLVRGDYDTYTSKTMLKSPLRWNTNGAVVTSGVKLASANTASNTTIYNKALIDCTYRFNITLDKNPGNNWVAVMLNANGNDVPWNDGFRSTMLFIYGNNITVQYWSGNDSPKTYESSLATGADFTETVEMECGIYHGTKDGEPAAFLYIAVNGTVIYDKVVAEMYDAAGFFGIMGYGRGYTLGVTDDEEDPIPVSATAPDVDRDNEALNKTVGADSWAVIANSFAPAYAYDSDADAMVLGGVGDVAFGKTVNFSKLSFKVKLDENAETKGEYIRFFFTRKRQDSFVGMKLEYNTTNYGYGLTVMPDGVIQIIKTDSGDGINILLEVQTDADFADGFHTITVYRDFSGGGAHIAVFVDNADKGYGVTDSNYYAANYPEDGYISFYHSCAGVSAQIKDIAFDGTLGEENFGKADALNFVTYYPGDEGNGEVFFVVDGASSTTKWVEMYGLDDGDEYTVLLGRAFYPERSIAVPDDYEGDRVKMVAVGFTPDLNRSTVIELRDTESDVAVETVERIAVRADEGGAYFVYAESGAEFVPVGGNYMGLRGGDHSTFDADTSFTDGDYDPVKADAMMRAVKENGGNVLRVFLIGRTAVNPGISGDSNIPVTDEDYYYEGLYIPYMENVVDFLTTAKKYGIYVMLTLGDADVPSNSYYLKLMGDVMLSRNQMYLSEKGVLARTTYAKNVVSYFKEKAPEVIPAIFSISCQNEFAMYNTEAPFSNKAGRFQAANGEIYDMSDADSRQACFEEGVIYYLNAMARAIKSVDPDMLVSEGSYTLSTVGNVGVHGLTHVTSGNQAFPATLDVYLASEIDFLDLHVYYRNRSESSILASFVNDLDAMNYGDARELLKSKPIFMGEFGADLSNTPSWDEVNGDLPSAHDFLLETVRLAKQMKIRGFAIWTLESHLQKDWWNILAYDGTLDTLREMAEIMNGEVRVSASDVAGNVGENNKITVAGTLGTDKVYYRTTGGDWSTENPVFTQAGVYTVEYKVEREFFAAATGSAQVTVAAQTSSGENNGNNNGNDDNTDNTGNGGGESGKTGGCGSETLGSSVVFGVVLLAFAALMAVKRKKA